ncbi:MAG TPA: GGDEF domain-containing protein [Noviherbaspirillum sp.]
MNGIQWPTEIGRQEREDALAAYRQRVMHALAIVAAAFLVPFAIYNLTRGAYALSAGLLMAVLILAVDAYALHRHRQPPIPFGLLLVPAIGGMAITLRANEFYGAMWAYPAVILFHFAMPRLKANLFSGITLAASGFLMLHYIGFELTVRFVVTLTLTIVLINIALNIIEDLHHRLIEQTILDPLTGTFNRRHLTSCLDYAIERSKRTGKPASLLLIDIDHFKQINDRYGHADGDRVLKDVVRVVRQRARKLDLLFRIGGEEFLLLLPDTHEDDAALVAEDVRAAVADTPMLHQWPVTVSIGVSAWHAGETADTWLKHGDNAMYVAKNNGRDRVVHRTSLLYANTR